MERWFAPRLVLMAVLTVAGGLCWVGNQSTVWAQDAADQAEATEETDEASEADEPRAGDDANGEQEADEAEEQTTPRSWRRARIGRSLEEAAAPETDQAATEQPTTETPSEEAAAPATVSEPKSAESAPVSASDESLEQQFSDYLHFAIIGEFDKADAIAQALLKQPDLNPLNESGAQRLLALTDKYENSMETLLLIINNSSIGQNARRILDLIREAHRRQRMNPSRIKENISWLAGTPTQRAVAMERLQDSGEYAVPWLLDVLRSSEQENLRVFVVRFLPELGKQAINPLVAALRINHPTLQRFVAEALGRIGYPQALPYLRLLAADTQVNPEVRQAAEEAFAVIIGGIADASAAKKMTATSAAALFSDLAEEYYVEAESLLSDPREERANVWTVRDNNVTPIEVPRDIYPVVMAMRCCEASLELDAQQPSVVALWLAANFRREGRLGLDVQSEESAKTLDLTRPADFPRSIYFARSAGPRHGELVLQRGIQSRDRNVALGAIAALSVTVGPAALLATDGPGASLIASLYFPDTLVRTRGALAIARAMPRQPFQGSEQVVATLAAALMANGAGNYLIVEPVQAVRDELAAKLAVNGTQVVAAGQLAAGLEEARKQFTNLDGVFLASDMKEPGAVEAVQIIGSDERFALAPVVLYAKPGGNGVGDRVSSVDKRVGHVSVVVDGEQRVDVADLAKTLVAECERVAERYGHKTLNAEQVAALALEAAQALKMITPARRIFDVRPAETNLVTALQKGSEPLRIACAEVLARIDSPTAQQMLAAKALDAEQSEAMRCAAFANLAISGRRFGARLEAAQSDLLIQQATHEPNLVLRTAASAALGSMNPAGDAAAGIILAQPRQ